MFIRNEYMKINFLELEVRWIYIFIDDKIKEK